MHAVGVALGVLGMSCGGKVCAGVGVERILPEVATIVVGQQVTPVFQTGGGCAGSNGITDAEYHTVPARWTTADTGVVSVDSLTGLIFGRKVGDARVSPRAATGIVLTVHVR